mmetsp:Transcript_8724/g.35711  ORF Transcript_8724/g.35711 Transcript_8724/m.35711 type:complete len:347 (-) Transcript_8724:1526-2566(-)
MRGVKAGPRRGRAAEQLAGFLDGGAVGAALEERRGQRPAGHVERQELRDEPEQPRSAAVGAAPVSRAGLGGRQLRRDAEGGGVELDLTLGGGGRGGDGDPRRVPRRPHGEMISILGSVALATAAWPRGYVEVFLRRLTAASAAAEVRWAVGARVERGGIGAASRAGRVPGGEVDEGAGDARVERRSAVGGGRRGGYRERAVQQERRHLGVLLLPRRQGVDDAGDDDVTPPPRDVGSGGGISQDSRERARVPGAGGVQPLARRWGRGASLVTRGRGVPEALRGAVGGGVGDGAARAAARRGYRLRRASDADGTHARGAVDAQVAVAALRVKAVVHGKRERGAGRGAV